MRRRAIDYPLVLFVLLAIIGMFTVDLPLLLANQDGIPETGGLAMRLLRVYAEQAEPEFSANSPAARVRMGVNVFVQIPLLVIVVLGVLAQRAGVRIPALMAVCVGVVNRAGYLAEALSAQSIPGPGLFVIVQVFSGLWMLLALIKIRPLEMVRILRVQSSLDRI